MKQPINKCDECGSDYYSFTSKMTHLCQTCSNLLYGYENCQHNFENSNRCTLCYWDGSSSEFLDTIKNNE